LDCREDGNLWFGDSERAYQIDGVLDDISFGLKVEIDVDRRFASSFR
jgi:hypothetical protein